MGHVYLAHDADHPERRAAVKVLAGEMLPELKTYGFMSWINTGAKDFRPSKPPELTARIDDPASFMPADWDRAAGDSGMAMPPNKVSTTASPGGTVPGGTLQVTNTTGDQMMTSSVTIDFNNADLFSTVTLTGSASLIT